MASPLGRLYSSPAAPAVAGIAGIVAGSIALVNAPDGFGAVAWALVLCLLAVLGRAALGLFGRPRSAAAFTGTLLANVPFVGALAYGTLQQHATHALTPLAAVLGVPVAVLALGALTIAAGACFAEERPRLERALSAAAMIACAGCIALGVWTRAAGVSIPSPRSYLGSLPVLGSADRLPLEYVAPDATISAERSHHVDHVGPYSTTAEPAPGAAVTIHRSCLAPEGPTFVVSRSCSIAIGDGVDPQQPAADRWVGPVSSYTALEVRVDTKRALWVVVADGRSYAFRADSTPTVVTLADMMEGPPRAWAFVAAPGALLAVVALLLRRRRRRLLEELAAGVDGTATARGWIALDDGRTVRVPDELAEGSRVVVIMESAGTGAYRNAELPRRVLEGDRATREADARAARTADALTALVAASATAAVLAAPLL